jgi:hypothetical protein
MLSNSMSQFVGDVSIMKNKIIKFIKKCMDIKYGLIYSNITRYVVIFIRNQMLKFEIFTICNCDV